MLANTSVDPDQTLCSAASDLGLHCLPSAPERDTRQIWVRRHHTFENNDYILEDRNF